MKNNNPEHFDVAWYIVHEDNLYEATMSKNGFIKKATPVKNKSLKPIAIEKCDGDFFIQAFDDMLMSAKDYLAAPIFTLFDIQDLIMRPADVAKIMNLTGNQTAEQRAQD